MQHYLSMESKELLERDTKLEYALDEIANKVSTRIYKVK